MIGILYAKETDRGDKVCCSLLPYDEKDGLLDQLAPLENALNEEARKKGYITGEFVANVFKEAFNMLLICDPEARIKNLEIDIF